MIVHEACSSVVATFETVEKAKQAKIALERLLADMKLRPDNYQTTVVQPPGEVLKHLKIVISKNSKTVNFIACNRGGSRRSAPAPYCPETLKHPLQILRKMSPEKCDTHLNYQELNVHLTLPRGMSLKTAAITLERDDVEAIRWFLSHVGMPISKRQKKRQILTWQYKGDMVYSLFDCNQPNLLLPDAFTLANHRRWTVNFLRGCLW
jgi:hypothetical protein